MSLPEGYLPRRGDEFLIRVRALHDARTDETDSMVHVEVVGNEHRKVFVDLDNIHSIYCRKWNVDDRVNLLGTAYEIPLEVIGVCDDKVWVRFPSGTMATYEANELEPYVEPLETMTEAELLDRLGSTYHLQADPVPISSQSVVGDDEEIKF